MKTIPYQDLQSLKKYSFIYSFLSKFNQWGFLAQNWASPNTGSLRDV